MVIDLDVERQTPEIRSMLARLIRGYRYASKIEAYARGWVFSVLVRLSGGACGKRVQIERGFRLRHGIHAGLTFGDRIYVGRGCTVDCPQGAQLSIGSRSTFTQGVFISAALAVEIGNDVMIGEYCSIRDANHGTDIANGPMNEQPMIAGAITIGNDIWLGRGCAVLAGSFVGNGAVIGANSVVAGSIPDFAVAVGAPARVVKSRVELSPVSRSQVDSR